MRMIIQKIIGDTVTSGYSTGGIKQDYCQGLAAWNKGETMFGENATEVFLEWISEIKG